MSSLDEFYAGGPRSWNEAFPAICVKAHWDPTAVSAYILPTVRQENPLDPRPASKICTTYYTTSAGDTATTTAQASVAPVAPGGRVPVTEFPLGGAAGRGFPNEYYQAVVNNESDIYRLGEPLTRCAERRYIPAGGAPAHIMGTNTVPGADLSNTSSLSPFLTEVRTQAGCRAEDDERAMARSNRLFSNPTRYDRTIVSPVINNACPKR